MEFADEAETIARGIGSDELLAFVLGCKAHTLVPALPHDDRTALAAAEEAVAAAGSGTNWFASMAWCMLGYVAIHLGDPQRAKAALLRAGGDNLNALQPSMRPLFLEILVSSALATGDTECARTWAERALKEAEQLDLPSQRASALRSAAHIKRADGDTAGAAALFEEAAELTFHGGAARWEAFSLLLGAPLTASTGHPDRARAMLERARDLASTGGAQQLTGLADAFSGAVLGTPAADDRPDAELASLTPREREIAAVITEGLTTPAIAARLYLSPRTVESHLARIYRKTGVTSRAALAALQTRSKLRGSGETP
ncbi:helix-turn-helix transcriptional regulator [Streptomyces anulatus]